MWLRSVYYLKKVFETLHYDRASVDRFQRHRIKNLLDICADFPFYQERWDEQPEGAGSLQQLPCIAADTFGGYTAFHGEHHSESGMMRQTSGTRGQPTRIKFSPQAHDWLSAIHMRTLYLNGYRLRQQLLQFWRSNHERRTLLGRVAIPTSHITPEASVQEQVQRLQQDNPDVLFYFPQSLLAVCKRLQSDEADYSGLQQVITYGELLTPAAKAYIEETLDAPVSQQYGTAEFGTIGWSCPDGGYHLAEDAVHADICDGDGTPIGDGQAGSLLLTGLFNEATPLVRYDIGDIVEPAKTEECSCDTAFKRISRVRGRRKDVFLNANGDAVYPDEVVDILGPDEQLLLYQLVASENQYHLRYVPVNAADERPAEAAASRLREELGIEPLTTEQVTSIPQSIGGKLQIIDNQQETIPATKLF